MDTIPIVFSANDYYIPYTAVAIQSVMEHKDSTRTYNFFILHQGIKENSQDALIQQVNNFSNCSIQFIDVSEYINGYKFFTSRHLSTEAYFRILIPYILPEYNKVIYMDGDMICLTNIAELFDIDIENYYLAAVRDIGVGWYYRNFYKKKKYSKNIFYEVLLKLKNPDEYFCSGMLLINTETFRRNYSQKNILELCASREWNVHDQDVLNYICDGKTLLLPTAWNFMGLGAFDGCPEHIRKECIAAEKSPKILHYKPWTKSYYGENAEWFWKYAARAGGGTLL